MKDLKLILFEKTHKALAEYSAAEIAYSPHVREAGSEGLRKIMNDRHQRFCAIWEIIEAAGLADEYQAWKESMA